MRIVSYLKEKMKTLRTTFELMDNRIKAKREMYEERFGDPENTDVSDIIEEMGGNDGE